MVFIEDPILRIVGTAFKAVVSRSCFVHLRCERFGLALSVLLGTSAPSAVHFGLMVFDGPAI